MRKDGAMTLREIVTFALQQGFTGKQVDQAARMCALNILNPDCSDPAIAIKVRSLNELIHMAHDGDPVLYIESGIFRYSVIYPPIADGFPISRVYTIDPIQDMFLGAKIFSDLTASGITFPPCDDACFGKKISAEGAFQRTTKYLDELSSRHAEFRSILDGRVKSTFVERGFIFSSRGCLHCGNDAGLLLTTVGADEGILVGFYLCPDHFMQAIQEKDGFLQYLCTSLGHPLPIRTFNLPPEFCVSAAADMLRSQLGCSILKIDGDTVTALRPSEVKLVMRVTSLTDYAYMIFDPSGIEKKRIDSAPHHAVAFGPDHIHVDPTNKKAEILPSFTYGFAPADMKIVRDLIEDLERNLRT